MLRYGEFNTVGVLEVIDRILLSWSRLRCRLTKLMAMSNYVCADRGDL